MDEGRAGAAFAQLRSIAGEEVDENTRSDRPLIAALAPHPAGSTPSEGEDELSKAERDLVHLHAQRTAIAKADLSPSARARADDELRAEAGERERQIARERSGDEDEDIAKLERGILAMLDARRDLSKSGAPRDVIAKADDRRRELERALQMRKSVGYQRLVEGEAA